MQLAGQCKAVPPESVSYCANQVSSDRPFDYFSAIFAHLSVQVVLCGATADVSAGHVWLEQVDFVYAAFSSSFVAGKYL